MFDQSGGMQAHVCMQKQAGTSGCLHQLLAQAKV